MARARIARERAGTLPSGDSGAVPFREPLSDALAVFGDDPGLHWAVLAERLAQGFPDRWAGATGESVSAELRAAGVPSATVTAAGAKARGCRKSAIEAAMG